MAKKKQYESLIGQFLAKMKDHPERFLTFLRRELGIKIEWKGAWGEYVKQRQIYDSVFENSETYVVSGNSTGKTFAAGVIGNAWLFCKRPSRTIYLSTKLSQTKFQAFSEFLDLYRKIRSWGMALGMYLPEPMTEKVKFSEQDWVMAWTASKDVDVASQAGAGFHGRNLLFIVDEALGIDASIKQAIDGCRTSVGNRLLAQGNPLRRSGWYYEGQLNPPPYRKIIHISALESPNVITGEEIAPGLASRQWVKQIIDEYGKDSAYYTSHVLGEFPQSGEDALIPWQAIQEAENRGKRFLECVKGLGVSSWQELSNKEGVREAARLIIEYSQENDIPIIYPDINNIAIGIDVADKSDLSVVTVMLGDHVEVEYAGHGLMHVVGHVVDILKKYGVWSCGVDAPGQGMGVVRRLQELGINVYEFQGGSKAEDSSKYLNLNAEQGWSLRNRFKEGKIDLPNVPELKQQTASIVWDLNSNSKIRVPKPKGKSPDYFDSLRIAHWAQELGQYDPKVVLEQLSRRPQPEYSIDGW